eukprot:749447-Hanusia_phi.AAC.2
MSAALIERSKSDEQCASLAQGSICSMAKSGVTCVSLCSYMTFNQMYDMKMLQVLAPGQDIIPCTQDSDCSYADGRLASSHTVLPICCSYVQASLTNLCEVSTTQVDSAITEMRKKYLCTDRKCISEGKNLRPAVYSMLPIVIVLSWFGSQRS